LQVNSSNYVFSRGERGAIPVVVFCRAEGLLAPSLQDIKLALSTIPLESGYRNPNFGERHRGTHMTLNHFKNIVIALLVFLALHQTSAIWFGDIDGGFFDVFARNRTQVAGTEFRRNFAFPMRIITGDGSQAFRVVYGGMHQGSATMNFCEEILLNVLSRDELPTIGSPGFGEVLTESIIIYEYAFEMPTDEFMRALGFRPGALSSSIERFNKIVFSPYRNLGLNVHFHNHNTGVWAGYFVHDAELAREFNEIVKLETRSPYSAIYFASSYLLGIDYNPYNNLFIPIWDTGGHRYFVGEAAPAHFDATDGAVMNVIRANIISFFDNPAAVYDVPTAGGFAWADENTIVRHFRTNVVQYISYRRDLRGSEFLDDFARALDFMDRRDLFMTNDFYLSGFREQGNERIFYFDYILEGLPVIFTDDLRNSISEQTTSGITIRFRDGNLVNYTRLAYTFTINHDTWDIAGRDLPLYILNSGLDLESLESVTLAFVAPRLDQAGASDMNLWVNFRMQDGISAMESLSIDVP